MFSNELARFHVRLRESRVYLINALSSLRREEKFSNILIIEVASSVPAYPLTFCHKTIILIKKFHCKQNFASLAFNALTKSHVTRFRIS